MCEEEADFLTASVDGQQFINRVVTAHFEQALVAGIKGKAHSQLGAFMYQRVHFFFRCCVSRVYGRW